jgi:hypothetical protein
MRETLHSKQSSDAELIEQLQRRIIELNAERERIHQEEQERRE